MRSSKAELSLRGMALAAALLSLVAAAGCGGSSSSNNNNNNNNNNQVIAGPGPNVVALTADSGPASLVPLGTAYLNGAFVTVTVCVPGTTTCQNVDHVLVDTGSFGLRLLDSTNGGAFSRATVPLPPELDASNNPIGECISFVDTSFLWGPVATADIKLSGETASSVPVHIVGDGNFTAVPSSCSSNGIDRDTLAQLGTNGIIGVGGFQFDCPGCETQVFTKAYYSCPASGCVSILQPLAKQVQNPVALFATDNNGVIVELPSVGSGGVPSATGALVFGIGTQTNNALGSASILTLDPNLFLTATFKGTSYPGSFIDSGSNGLFILDTPTLGIATCTDAPDFYCPSSTQNLSATNQGVNGTTTNVSFSIANADNLFASQNFIFNNIGGQNSGSFDWGLPFFMGRNVFVTIEGKTAPGATPPYVAY